MALFHNAFALIMSTMVAVIVASHLDSSSVFVALNGNDSWSGLLPAPAPCMCDGPLQSLPAGLRLAQARAASALLIREGVYRLNSTLEIVSTKDIVISAFPNETVVISGGVQLVGTWVPGPQPSIWQLNVPQQYRQFNQLWRNNTRLVRARSPNYGSFFKINADLNGSLAGQGFVYSGADLDNLAHLDPVQLAQCNVVLYRSWQTARRTFASVDDVTHTARLVYSAGIEPTGNSEGRYYVENFLEALDEPGEYFMDAATGVLHYFAAQGEDPNALEFVAPVVVSDLIVMQDATNVTLRDVSLQHVDWDRTRAIQDSGAIQVCQPCSLATQSI